MMAHASCLLRCQEVAARGREEIEYRLVLERGRVGHIDDDLRAGQYLEPLAGECVDPRLQRCCNCLVAVLGQPCNNLGADEPGAADHYDFRHSEPSTCGKVSPTHHGSLPRLAPDEQHGILFV